MNLRVSVNVGLSVRRSLVAAFFGLLAASVVLIASHGVAWCDPNADLWSAVKKGDVAAAHAAITAGADVNAKDNDGDTLLQKAAWDGNKDLVALLIATGANVNAKDDKGDTPLLAAAGAYANRKDVAELLIAKGADLNARDQYDRTPLFKAAQSKNGYDMVQLLVSKGAPLDVKATDKSGNTLLHAAASGGNKDLVALLIAKGADVNAKNHDAYGDTPLHVAAGAYANTKEVAELLIAKGADINAKNRSGETPLFKAADSGNSAVAALLIAKGADVNAKNQGGETSLFGAARFGHGDVVTLLIAKGADVNAKNQFGKTPLFDAAFDGNTDVAALLIAKSADVNAKDQYGRTPLFEGIRASFNTKNVVELLIAKGANINATDKTGWTPIHYASEPIAELLTAKGADATKALAPDPFFSGLKAARAGNWNEAIKDFIKARDSAPGKPEVYFNLALALEKYDRNSLSAMCFEAYLALVPNAANKDQVRSEITRLTAQARAQMAMVFGSAIELAAAANRNRPADYAEVAENFARAGELSKAFQYGALAAESRGVWSTPDSREVLLRTDYAFALELSGLNKEAIDQVTYIKHHFALSDQQKKPLATIAEGKFDPWYVISNALRSYERDPISFETAVHRTQQVNDPDQMEVKVGGWNSLMVVENLSQLGSRVGLNLLQLAVMQQIWRNSPQCRDPNNASGC